MDIGEAMRTARKKAGLTIEKLSKKTYITPLSISNYENNKTIPGLLNLLDLADALNISIDEYIGREV